MICPCDIVLPLAIAEECICTFYEAWIWFHALHVCLLHFRHTSCDFHALDMVSCTYCVSVILPVSASSFQKHFIVSACMECTQQVRLALIKVLLISTLSQNTGHTQHIANVTPILFMWLWPLFLVPQNNRHSHRISGYSQKIIDHIWVTVVTLVTGHTQNIGNVTLIFWSQCDRDHYLWDCDNHHFLQMTS